MGLMLAQFRSFWLFMAVFAVAVCTAAPDLHARELSMREARYAITSGRAVPFVAALRSARAVAPGKVLRARMVQCPDGRLVFRFKMLSRGRVQRVIIGGRSGLPAPGC